MVLAPDYETDEFDFIWGNFNQTAESRVLANENFLETAPEIDASFREVASCQEIENYNTGIIPLT